MKNQNSNQPADINMAVCDRNANVLPMLQTYTTKVLKPNIIGRRNILTQQMMDCEGYKYVIRWDFDLNGKTVTVPANCIIEFDGGSLKNGTITGQDTAFFNVGDVEIWGENLTRQGAWEELHVGAQSDWNQTDEHALDYIKNKPKVYTKEETDEKYQPKGDYQPAGDYAPASDTQRIVSLEQAVGNGGSVDSRIATAKAEIIGGATPGGNTLKKVEDRLSPVETAVGSGGSIDTRIANAVEAEVTRAEAAEGELRASVNAEVTARNAAVSSETVRAQNEEENLRQLYEALTQSDIVVADSVPASGAANTIYRVTGTNSYADYMFNSSDLNTPIKMAEYDNAIDDEPTAGSNNLVKSGGVYDGLRATGTNLIKTADILIGKYINASGVITNASSGYRVAKVQISEDTNVILNIPGTESSMGFVEYTDNTYSTVKRFILKNGRNRMFSGMLTVGNYAVGYSSAYGEAQMFVNDVLKELSFGGTTFKFDGVIKGARIESNGIFPVPDPSYAVKKIKIDEDGDFLIRSSKVSDACLFAEFEDSSYSNVSRVIIGKKRVFNIEQVLHLTAGYYAMQIFEDETQVNEFKAYIPDGNEKESMVSAINSEQGKYINDSGIISDASQSYFTATLELEQGTYEICTNGSGSGCSLVQYTDNTYETVRRIYSKSYQSFGNRKIFKLDHGFYGICLMLKSNDGFYRLISPVDEQYPNCVFSREEVVIHNRINRPLGNIVVSAGDTFVVTRHLEEGYYNVSLIGNTDCLCLVRYTDDTYSSVDYIYPNNNYMMNEKLYLEEGYYGICWAGEQSPVFEKAVSYKRKEQTTFNLDNRNIVKMLDISQSVFVDCVFDSSDIQEKKGMYGAPYIQNLGGSYYKVAKFHVDSGFYHVVCTTSGSCMMLNKFLDSGCVFLDKMIYGVAKDLSCIMYLEEGYYAFGWNDYDGGVAYISATLPSTKWNVSNGVFSNTAPVTVKERLMSKYRTYANDWNLSAVIKPKTMANGAFECAVGKIQLQYSMSTLVCLGKDGNGSYIALSTIDDETDPNAIAHKYKEYLSGFNLETDKEYTVTLEQRDGTYRYHNISIVTNRGVEYRYNQLEPDWQNTVGGGWGEITVIPTIGTCEVRNLYFGYPADFNDLQLVVIGHSFVEGMNTTVTHLDKRFATMLAEKIGKQRCVIKGMGGADVTTVGPTLVNDLEMLHSARYVIFCIGTNDRDVDEVGDTLRYFDRTAKQYGITPIWLTVTPKANGTEKTVLNSYISRFENVVDVSTIFYNEDGTVNTSLLPDGIHPSIEGYQRIYNMIAAQCSYLLY